MNSLRGLKALHSIVGCLYKINNCFRQIVSSLFVLLFMFALSVSAPSSALAERIVAEIFEGYVGVRGTSTVKLETPIRLSDFIDGTVVTFEQEDHDGDGLFGLPNGNDITGFLRFDVPGFTALEIPGVINWRTDNTQKGFGFLATGVSCSDSTPLTSNIATGPYAGSTYDFICGNTAGVSSNYLLGMIPEFYSYVETGENYTAGEFDLYSGDAAFAESNALDVLNTFYNAQVAAPSIEGWKLSSLTDDADSSGGLSAGDTLTYTITIRTQVTCLSIVLAFKVTH